MVGFGPQDFGEDGVEGAHPERTRCRADQLGDTVFHLLGGLVGEGQRQYAERVRADFQKVRDPVGEGAGLARTGSGNDHDWSLGMFGGRPLFRVQSI